MSYFWTGHQTSIIAFLGVLLAIALSNLLTWKRLERYPPASVLPRVSVLLPVRNEAQNVGPCLRSLMLQDYGEYEILALDDDSQDSTASELARLGTEEPRLQVLKGKPLPDGWLGKHWACHQLAVRGCGHAPRAHCPAPCGVGAGGGESGPVGGDATARGSLMA